MISMIGAVDLNGAIGKNNQLLCHLPDDLKYFKRVTEGSAVVMGRRTFESIGKPLPNRYNIILTRDLLYPLNNSIITTNSVESVLRMHKAFSAIPMFIIGGEQVYRQFIDHVDRIYLTKIHHSFDGADSFFPELTTSDWKLKSFIKNHKDEKNQYEHDFVIYDRRKQ